MYHFKRTAQVYGEIERGGYYSKSASSLTIASTPARYTRLVQFTLTAVHNETLKNRDISR